MVRQHDKRKMTCLAGTLAGFAMMHYKYPRLMLILMYKF